MKTTFNALLSAGQPVIADGGMGTMLFAAGLARGETPELWNVEQPDAVRAIHRSYIAAGAQIILTNTFGGNRYRLAEAADRVAELNRAGAALARAEADDAPAPVLVAGSMGPTGLLMEPIGPLTPAQAESAFAEQVAALAAGGVDVLWIETMSDLEEVRAAIAGARAVAPDLPLVATMTFDTKGRTMMGVRPETAVSALTELGVVALGGNCGNGPEEIESVIARMHSASPDAVLVAKANAGLPKIVDGQPVYDATPAVMGAYALRVRDQGARIIGACCGSTPAHVQAIAESLRG